jgi:hypothetical protein
MRTPRTFVLRWEAYQRYTQNDLSVIDKISNEIERKLDPHKPMQCAHRPTSKTASSILLPGSSKRC